jgi:hypothetical protein
MSDKFECACDYDVWGSHSNACHDREVEFYRADMNRQLNIKMGLEQNIIRAADAWAKSWEPIMDAFTTRDVLNETEQILYDAVLAWRTPTN